jgi:hypothetical protein
MVHKWTIKGSLSQTADVSLMEDFGLMGIYTCLQEYLCRLGRVIRRPDVWKGVEGYRYEYGYGRGR